MSTKPALSKHSFLRNIAPLLAFTFSICLLVLFCYEAGHTTLPPTEKRYMTAKAGISSLKQDVKKGNLRESWEKLATEFKSIYDGDPNWPNRPAALFRSAEALEELARRSCGRQDARKAVNCYESLALKHSQSRLADDALFRAAKLRAAMLKDEKGALALLARIKKQYPKGDMAAQAEALEKALKASSNGKTAPEALKIAAAADSLPEEAPARISPKGAFAGDVPLRFKSAKTRMQALKNDATRSCWRQPWEDLREEFLRIRKQGKNSIPPGALFMAAESQKALAQCSRLAVDGKKAIELYKSVAREFPKSGEADDALMAAARLEYAQNKKQDAIDTVKRVISAYPKGDRYQDARKLLAIWGGQDAPRARTAQARAVQARPEVQVLSWDSINKNRVEIILELSGPIPYTTKLEKGAKTSQLVLNLENASIVEDIRKGVAVNGSLLKAIRVAGGKNGPASMKFEFREVKRFDARMESNPCRIILNVAAGNAKLPQKPSGKSSLAARVKATQVADMASQLGLTVNRVFLDPGHGGKDPGTSHNKVVERDVTLDVALSLGKLLQANGLEVIYSRTTNKYVPLSERTRMANAANADIFVSIHVNANGNASASGFETYYLDLATNKQAARVAMLENAMSDKRLGDMQSMLTEVMLHARANESKRLASDIQRLTVSRLMKREYPTRSNGVKSAPFHVLLGARMPAVLVEIGYCSNHTEARNLASPKYRQALAVGLAEGIVGYRDRLLRNRTAGK